MLSISFKEASLKLFLSFAAYTSILFIFSSSLSLEYYIMKFLGRGKKGKLRYNH